MLQCGYLGYKTPYVQQYAMKEYKVTEKLYTLNAASDRGSGYIPSATHPLHSLGGFKSAGGTGEEQPCRKPNRECTVFITAAQLSVYQARWLRW
jgi:hypothetical protein